MDIVLIIGISVYICGGIALGAHGKREGMSWLFLSIVIPFLGVSYRRRYWSEIGWTAYLQLVGIVLILTYVLMQAGRIDADRRHAPAFVAKSNPDAWSDLALSARPWGDEEAARAEGRLAGRPFIYRRAELIDGVLRFKSSREFFSDVELTIHLGAVELKDRKTFFVGNDSETHYEIQLVMIKPGTQAQVRVFDSGYRLEMELVRFDSNIVNGYIELILPDEERSYLRGPFVAYTNNLRYKNDKVDLTHDHEDTLEYVVLQHVKQRHPELVLDNLDFVNTRILSDVRGASTVVLTMNNGNVFKESYDLEKNDYGWRVLSPGAGEAHAAGSLSAASSVALYNPPAGDGVAVRDVVIHFEQLADYVGRTAVVRQRDGVIQQGRIKGLRKGRLVIEVTVGAGGVEYFVQESDIEFVSLPSGERLTFDSTGTMQDKEENTIVPGDAVSGEPVAIVEQVDAAAEGDAAVADSALVEQMDGAEIAPAALDENQWLGKPVVLITTSGNTQTGVLKRIDKRQYVLELAIGAGKMEKFIPRTEVVEIQPAESR